MDRAELQRRHVTNILLWQAYKEAQPAALPYSQFCDKYQRWAQQLSATMRQAHRFGEKTFIDFSGDDIDKAVLFVALLGGGLTAIGVPDTPKAAVTRADRYDPDLNPT